MFGKPTLKLRTATNEKYKLGALFVDKAILPTLQSLIDKANEKLRPHGLIVAADISWMISEIIEETKDEQTESAPEQDQSGGQHGS